MRTDARLSARALESPDGLAASGSTQGQRLLAAVSVYGGALTIGLTLVSFPASSTYLRATHGFSDTEYGAIYLPQLLAAIAGAIGGGVAAARLSLRVMYVLALLCFALAQGLLALSAGVSSNIALATVMCATAAFGFGFGFGGGPLNAAVALLFPRTTYAAITALHMVAGAGLTAAPFAFASLAGRGIWIAGPLALLLITITLLFLAVAARWPEPVSDGGSAARLWPAPARSSFFWLTALIAVLYSVAEGTFSNWALIYVQEDRGFSASTAALALTSFWAALTIGRLLASFLALRLQPIAFLVALPVLTIVSFLYLPLVTSEATVVAGFALAGFACSAFFPMLVGYAADVHPQHVSWIASMLTAAMMLGVGIGSYAIGALRSSVALADLYRASAIYPVLVLMALFAAARSRTQFRESRANGSIVDGKERDCVE